MGHAKLTMALVVPAINSKMKNELTLHHATLVLNFATLSTITSVSSAPMVPIWRRVNKKGKTRGAITREEADKTRGRIILSLALLMQIVLQWAWTVLMFVNPYYAQAPCSPSTIIVYIGGIRTAAEINKEYFASWAVWLLLCVCGVLIYGVIMVFSCPSHVHDTPISGWPDPPDEETWRERLRYWGWTCHRYVITDEHYVSRWWIRLSQIIAFSIVAVFVGLSERQIVINTVLQGENEVFSFSQVRSRPYFSGGRSVPDSTSLLQMAAILLAVAPVWPIAIAWLRRPPRVPGTRRQNALDTDTIIFSNGTGETFSPDSLISPPSNIAIQEQKQIIYDSPKAASSLHLPSPSGSQKYMPVSTMEVDADDAYHTVELGYGSSPSPNTSPTTSLKKTPVTRALRRIESSSGLSSSQDTMVNNSNAQGSLPGSSLPVPESYPMTTMGLGLGLTRSPSSTHSQFSARRNRSRSSLSFSETP